MPVPFCRWLSHIFLCAVVVAAAAYLCTRLAEGTEKRWGKFKAEFSFNEKRSSCWPYTHSVVFVCSCRCLWFSPAEKKGAPPGK